MKKERNEKVKKQSFKKSPHEEEMTLANTIGFCLVF